MSSKPLLDDKARRKARSEHNAKADERFYAKVRKDNGGELPADMVDANGQPRKLTNRSEDAHYRQTWHECSAAERAAVSDGLPAAGSADAGSACQPCAAEQRRKEKQNSKECSLADVVIERVKADVSREYVRSGGKWVEKDPTEQPLHIKLRDIRAGKCSSLLQLVAGPSRPGALGVAAGAGSSKARKRIKVKCQVAAGPCDEARHPWVRLDGETSEVRKGSSEAADARFDMFYDDPDPPGVFDLRRWWNPDTPPRRLSIEIAACGHMKHGEGNSGGSLTIETFPCSQYAVKLKLPPFRSWTESLKPYEKKYDREKKGYVVSDSHEVGKYSFLGGDSTDSLTTERTSKGTEITQSSKRGDNDYEMKTGEHGTARWLLSGRSEPSEQAVFEVSRDGVTESLGGDIIKLVNWLRYWRSKLDDLKDLILNFMPQCGAKVDASLRVLEGSLMCSWGFKEHSDYRVYFGWTISVDLLILGGALSASFGVQMSSLLTAKVQLDFEPDISLKFDRTLDDPDKPPGEGVEVAHKFEARGSAIAEAGPKCFGWKYELGVKSGYEVRASLAVDPKFSVTGSLKFLGVSAYIETKDVLEPVETDLYHLVQEGEAQLFELPPAVEHPEAPKSK